MAASRPARILVVCTGNICRSPMAEALLRTYLHRHLDDADIVEVSSAGTHARIGDPASSGMQAVATDWGVPLASHWSRPTTAELVADQDLVLTMESMHRERVARLGPGMGSRTFLITEAAGLVAALGQDTTAAGQARPADRLATFVTELHQARSRHTPDTSDVADPYGGSHQEYLECAWQLAGLVETLGPALARALATSTPGE